MSATVNEEDIFLHAAVKLFSTFNTSGAAHRWVIRYRSNGSVAGGELQRENKFFVITNLG